MKKTAILILVVTILIISCKSENKNTKFERPIAMKGLYVKPVPQPDIKEVHRLVNGRWIYEGFYDNKKRYSADDFVGRWYEFNIDGSFQSGRDKETTAVGSWNYDQKSKILTIDSDNNSEDFHWAVHFPSTKTIGFFVGVSGTETAGIQGKLKNYEKSSED